MSHGHWWCPKCQESVTSTRVTFQENHDACGHPVTWVEFREAPSPSPDAGLREALERMPHRWDCEINKLLLNHKAAEQKDCDCGRNAALASARAKGPNTGCPKHGFIGPKGKCLLCGWPEPPAQDRGAKVTVQRFSPSVNDDGEAEMIVSPKGSYVRVENYEALLQASRPASQGDAEAIQKAVADEPECPDEMPEELWEAIKGDKDALQECIRIAIRLTKKGIAERLAALTPPVEFQERECYFCHAVDTKPYKCPQGCTNGKVWTKK